MTHAPTAVSMGLCTCAGAGVDAAWSLLTSISDVALSRLDSFESPRYQERYVGKAHGYDACRSTTSCGKILMSALDEALAGIDKSALRSERVGVFFGTSIGGIFETENMLEKNGADAKKDLRPLAFYECSTLAELVAKRTGARGVCATFSTACSSSSLAISAACDAIEQGTLDAAIVCGADSLSRITVNGFGALLLLSQEKCKPFDAARDGINLGEAAGVLILSSLKFAKKINAKPLADFVGCACTADAHHATAPRPDGAGAAAAFSGALQTAGLNASDIDFYIAHGTATRGNDVAEVAALRNVFGENNIPKFASVKRFFGHTLGASGILNAILAVRAIQERATPPNAGFSAQDPQICASPNCAYERVEINNILTSSLGFGGNNSCSIIAQPAFNLRCDSAAREMFIFGAGAVSSVGTDAREICAKISEKSFDIGKEPSTCAPAELLKEIPSLKKRKWAHLQQMGLQSALESVSGLKIETSVDKIGVCMGTGLGMTAETLRFISNAISKREAEPLPTAFTNSVHNAVSSLISVQCEYRGLNSAVTAKEVSFESALFQARGALNSGALDAAIVGSCDEYSEYACDFLKYFAKLPHSDLPLTDFCATYFVGTENSCLSAPLARIIGVDLARRKKNAVEESEAILRAINSCGLSAADIKAFIAPSLWNYRIEKFTAQLSDNLFGFAPVRLDKFIGANYSASAFAPLYALKMLGKGVYLSYSPASTGMRAIILFEIL